RVYEFTWKSLPRGVPVASRRRPKTLSPLPSPPLAVHATRKFPSPSAAAAGADWLLVVEEFTRSSVPDAPKGCAVASAGATSSETAIDHLRAETMRHLAFGTVAASEPRGAPFVSS